MKDGIFYYGLKDLQVDMSPTATVPVYAYGWTPLRWGICIYGDDQIHAHALNSTFGV